MARRSTDPAGSSVGMPCTWQRKPRLANSSACVMPDLASRKLARTSCVLLPMDETMPIPVTTTRLMATLPHPRRGLSMIGPHLGRPRQLRKSPNRVRGLSSSAARLQRRILLEQADLEVAGAVDYVAIRRKPAVSDAQHQLSAHHALDVDAVDDLLHRRQHLSGEFQLAQAQ